MSMTPEQFHDLLDRDTQLLPPAPADDPVALGRRRLRRRRVTASAGAALAVVAVAGVAGVAGLAGHGLPGDHARDHSVLLPAAPHGVPRTDADLLASCAHGNQSDKATRLLFGPGTPTVESAVRTSHQVILAIQSADGRYWADCFVHLDNEEFGSGMEVFPSDPQDSHNSGFSSEGTSYSFGPGCGLVGKELDPTCTLWSVNAVDRLPDAVAAVRYDFGDGTSETVSSAHGYVVLNHLGTFADGGTVGTDGDFPANFQPLTRVTYLDASGTPIAAEAESGHPEKDGTPDGLPPLSTYPSLRGEGIY